MEVFTLAQLPEPRISTFVLTCSPRSFHELAMTSDISKNTVSSRPLGGDASHFVSPNGVAYGLMGLTWARGRVVEDDVAFACIAVRLPRWPPLAPAAITSVLCVWTCAARTGVASSHSALPATAAVGREIVLRMAHLY